MLELLLRIEKICLESDLSPLTLLVIGIVCTLLGLFLWLGGLRYSSLIIGLIGAMLGSLVGLMVSHWTGIHPVICALAGAGIFTLLALQLKNIVVIVLAIMLFATASGTGYMTYILNRSPDWHKTLQKQDLYSGQLLEQPNPGDNLVDSEEFVPSGKWIAKKGGDFLTRLKKLLSDTWQSMSPHQWKLFLWILLGGLGGFILIWIVKRIVMAFCYSTVGAACVISGVEILLLAKGTALMSAMESRPKVLPIILMAMVFFGWFFQLIFVRSSKAKPEKSTSQEKKGNS